MRARYLFSVGRASSSATKLRSILGWLSGSSDHILHGLVEVYETATVLNCDMAKTKSIGARLQPSDSSCRTAFLRDCRYSLPYRPGAYIIAGGRVAPSGEASRASKPTSKSSRTTPRHTGNRRSLRYAFAVKHVPEDGIDGGRIGKLSLTLPPYVTVEHDTKARRAIVEIQDKKVREQREMWGTQHISNRRRVACLLISRLGTTRAYLQNHVMGVSEGHIAILSLVGVGYRATIESSAITLSPEYPGQQFVSLKVGFAHPVELGVPKGVKASTPQPTRILLEGPEREVVFQFAAKIRMWRKPEPYKGKGIFVNGETIKLKAKKIK